MNYGNGTARCIDEIPPGKVRTGINREEVHQMHKAGMSGAEIARQFGVDRTTIYAHLHKSLDAPVQVAVNVEEILRLRATGMKIKDIAKQLGISKCAIYAHLPKTDRDVPQFEKGPDIVRLKESGMTVAQIAEQLGLTGEAIYFHLRNLGLGKPRDKSIDSVTKKKNELAAQVEMLQKKLNRLE